MRYKFIKIDKENESILISVDDVEMWVDYRKNEDGFFEWEFNKFVFLMWKKAIWKYKKNKRLSSIKN